jgi:hypothetical protein
MVIQYFKMVVVNALLISFEMDLRTLDGVMELWSLQRLEYQTATIQNPKQTYYYVIIRILEMLRLIKITINMTPSAPYPNCQRTIPQPRKCIKKGFYPVQYSISDIRNPNAWSLSRCK